MHEGSTVFAQLMAQASRFTLDRCIRRYGGNRRIRRFSCRDQFLVMAFAQLTYRESLRDIEACLGAMPERLYHMGIGCKHVARNTLARANEKRDWRIYADFAATLIQEARALYADEPLGVALDRAVYALDSTTIELCLSLFPWAHFPHGLAGVKVHTLLDLRGSIPQFVWITPRRLHDVRILDELRPEPGAIYVLDRGYFDLRRLQRLHQAGVTFVIRSKRGVNLRRRYSRSIDRSLGLRSDHTVTFGSFYAARDYPDQLRRVRYRNPEDGRHFVFLTNNFTLPALSIAQLYRSRWRVELFFRWIKQHLRIKTFYGTSPNAVKTQIWIAISVYLLVAIARKRLRIERDLYSILQILSLTTFEKIPLAQALSPTTSGSDDNPFPNQLSLFNF